VLNLSGGEPLLHPRLFDLIDECLSRKEIVRVSVSTNGLALARDPKLADGLKKRDVVVSLQFDGFDDNIYASLRGRPLLREKQAALDLLAAKDMTASLTMTVAGGVNETALPSVLRYYFSQPHLVSLMLQPLAYVGRAADWPGRGGDAPRYTDAGAKVEERDIRAPVRRADSDWRTPSPEYRLTIPTLVRILGDADVPPVAAEDFVPLPCSHPLCFSLAFYLMLDDGGAVSMNRLADASTLMDALSNRVVFGLDAREHEKLKAMIYDLWSGPVGAVPEGKSIMGTLKGILRQLTGRRDACCSFDPRNAFQLAERRVKSVFIHAFQDVDTFDLARVRRCCQGYPQRDGRILPACVRNCRPRLRADGC